MTGWSALGIPFALGILGSWMDLRGEVGFGSSILSICMRSGVLLLLSWGSFCEEKVGFNAMHNVQWQEDWATSKTHMNGVTFKNTKLLETTGEFVRFSLTSRWFWSTTAWCVLKQQGSRSQFKVYSKNVRLSLFDNEGYMSWASKSAGEECGLHDLCKAWPKEGQLIEEMGDIQRCGHVQKQLFWGKKYNRTWSKHKKCQNNCKRRWQLLMSKGWEKW